MGPDSNPYDFITNPGQPARRSMINGPTTPKQRVLMIGILVGGLLVLVIIFWMVLGALTRENFDDIVKVARTQQKILFTTGLALKESSTPEVRALAATIRSSVLSDSAGLEDYLVKQVSKDVTKRIGDGKDKDIQEAFDAAVQTGRVDATFYQTIDELLGKYKSDLGAALGDSKRKSEKDLLNDANADVIYFQKARAG